MEGILLVDKPAGWTSHDVVAKVRANIKAEAGQKIKVGHSGTLDPMATGLLVLLIGSYTKSAGDFSKLDKTYEAEITLGATSTTGDAEGEITQGQRAKDIAHVPTKMEVEKVLESFLGEIEQTPHAYSAVKVDGQRAYKLARAGKKPKIEPRQVTIYELRILSYEYPKIKIRTKVSSGTYIRSLAEDIGQKLGSGAYVSALRRTRVSQFDIREAVSLDNIDLKSIYKFTSR